MPNKPAPEKAMPKKAMQGIIDAIEAGACIITSTKRLSTEVKAAYDAAQIAQQKQVWQSAQIFTWDAWMQHLYNEQVLSHASAQTSLASCLHSSQITQLLEDIIQGDINQKHDDDNVSVLWNVPASAKVAQQAWQLCHQWQISFKNLKRSAHEDHAKFGVWASKLYAKLRALDAISPDEIPDILASKPLRTRRLNNSATNPLRQAAVLFGFDHFNPQQQNFIDSYQKQGNKLSILSTSAKRPLQAEVQRYAFEDSRAQWQQIAAWARRKLDQQPDLKIGIITPDIQSIRAIASQALREQLSPRYFTQATTDPFHFSQGEPLAALPMIKAAFDCLNLLLPLDFEQVSAHFLSPEWGDAAEQDFRAKSVLSLRNKIAYRFDLFQLINALSSSTTEDDGKAFVEKLNEIQSIKSRHKNALPLCQWRAIFNDCLTELQWPISGMNSEQFQTKKSWDIALLEWSKLDAVCQPMRLNDALKSLQRHCQQTPFQAQAASGAPVQIMGILEASGMTFDALWLADFDEKAWPKPAHPNPFIPLEIQNKADIPEASIALQAERAEQKTNELLQLCTETNISHAALSSEGIKLNISPLLADKPKLEVDSKKLGAPINFAAMIHQAANQLEHEKDDVGLPLQGKSAKGGTGMIEAHSQCPFRAYAKYRLQADEQALPEAGMDNMQQGSLLHRILESIWRELKTSDKLQALIKDQKLNAMIASHCDNFIPAFARNSGLGEGFITTEQKRLQQLLSQWLSLEATREAFSISATEQTIRFDLGGLALNFKIDRIDTQNLSGQNSRIIIDYKSGNCELKNWAGQRPPSPQMPLYYLALANETLEDEPLEDKQQEKAQRVAPVSAVALAQVKDQACEFVGLSESDGILPKVKSIEKLGRNNLIKEMEEWSKLLPTWQTRLENLAEEILSGLAIVDPQNCDYCDFSPFCRISALDKQTDENHAD